MRRRRLFITCANFATRPEDLLGGVTSFLLSILPEVERRDEFETTVIAMQFKGMPAESTAGETRIVRLPTRRSQQLSVHQVAALPEPQFLANGGEFGQAATEFLLRHARPGDSCMVNDFFESPEIARLQQHGLRCVVACHILPSEFIFHEYIADRFVGDTQMTRRFSLLAAAALRFLQRHVHTHHDLVAFFDSIRRRGLSMLIPRVVRMSFDKEREAIELCEGILVPTTVMRDKLIACYPRARGRVHVVPWGVEQPPPREAVSDAIEDLRRGFALEPEGITLLTLSRISPEKGIEFVIDALRQLEEDAPSLAQRLTLFICGRPSLTRGETYLAELRAGAARLRHVTVHFPGFVSGEQKHGLLYLADIYLLPSKYESFGLTLLEAMSHECAVIASDTDGSRDVVQPTFGEMLQFDHTDDRVGSMRDAIRELATADCKEMGRLAKRHSETYTWSRVVDVFVEALGQEPDQHHEHEPRQVAKLES